MIVVNVGADHINTYLKKKKYAKDETTDGKAVEYWVNDLIKQGLLDVDDFEKFLFEELFFGKRKNIRFYKLDQVSALKNPVTWLNHFKEKYDVNHLEFKNIMTSIPTTDRNSQIAAISSEIDRKGNISKIRILFAEYAEISEEGRLKVTVSYFPVEIDLNKKCMIIKDWNRQGLAEGYKSEMQLDHIVSILSMSFGVKTKSFKGKHKRTLHNMSRALVNDVYEKIPSFKQIDQLDNAGREFQQKVLKTLPLENVVLDGKEYHLEKNVFDFNDELRKIIEKLCISDYFYNIPYEDIWHMGVETIVSKIKFKDLEHVLTILSGEASETPIFCTKTFLSLKKSLEDAKMVERLWIEHDRESGMLSLSYDATKEEYLGMKILSNIRYTQKDLETAEEIYNSYAGDTTEKVKRCNQRCAV